MTTYPIVALAALLSATPASAQQVTVQVIEVEDSKWETPNSNCEPDDEKCLWVHAPEHPGKLTERDRCLWGSLGPSGDAWCDATWVKTRIFNHTPFVLYVITSCTACDRTGRVLGTGTDEFWPGTKNRDIIGVAALGQGGSNLRLDKVKYADVARVECRPSKISK
jgi:hypothetical protein